MEGTHLLPIAIEVSARVSREFDTYPFLKVAPWPSSYRCEKNNCFTRQKLVAWKQGGLETRFRKWFIGGLTKYRSAMIHRAMDQVIHIDGKFEDDLSTVSRTAIDYEAGQVEEENGSTRQVRTNIANASSDDLVERGCWPPVVSSLASTREEVKRQSGKMQATSSGIAKRVCQCLVRKILACASAAIKF